ncbi:unnamed protein product [Ixodes hexagonus]
MADKICGDGIGNSSGRLYSGEVELIAPSTMYGSSPGEPRTPVQPLDSAGPKKKPTSFQITSVTVQGSRLSNDGGDESADDLDESHTEDLSSDVLEPPKSADGPADEDTPADEPPGSAAPTAGDAGVPSPGPVPAPAVQPPAAATTTSTVPAGAALAIVTGTPAGTAPDVPVSPDHWQRRFKVVKIVSSEPFGRGRWLCMDFVDPPAMQGDAKAGDERESAAGGGSDLPPAASNEAVAHVYEIPVGQTFPANSQQGGPLYGIILPVAPSAQGAPLGVLQPIAEQTADAPAEADAAAEHENKSTTAEDDSERWVPASARSGTPRPPDRQLSAQNYTAQNPSPTGASATLAFKAVPKCQRNTTSAGSTVAIDNKIEQAMDLVKSHLMFAVREEVDVLKEKITELLDRISQLEYENGVLRAGASPETLSLLSQPQPLAPQQPAAQQQPAVAPQPVVAAQPAPATVQQPQAPAVPQMTAAAQQPQQQPPAQSMPPPPT